MRIQQVCETYGTRNFTVQQHRHPHLRQSCKKICACFPPSSFSHSFSPFRGYIQQDEKASLIQNEIQPSPYDPSWDAGCVIFPLPFLSFSLFPSQLAFMQLSSRTIRLGVYHQPLSFYRQARIFAKEKRNVCQPRNEHRGKRCSLWHDRIVDCFCRGGAEYTD